MAPDQGSKREGLNPLTLIVAAVASGVAAIVVSRFWRDGTVLAAAMTPVIVSVVKEALQRPMESEVVRRSASKVGQVATAPLKATSRGAPGDEPGPQTQTMPPRTAQQNGDGDGSREVVMVGPRRTYSSGGGEGGGRGGFLSRLRGPRLNIAVITGLLAFVVAAAALTLPELIFGGSVSSSGRTTFFGGGTDSGSEKGDERDGDRDSNNPDSRQRDESDQEDQNRETQPQDRSEEPQEQTPSAPEETTPAPQQDPPPPSSQPPPSGGGGGGGGGTLPEVPTPNAPAP